MSTDRFRNIDNSAGDWLARRDSGDWTEEEQRRFEQWLNESPLHRVAFLRLEDVWERAQRLQALGAGASSSVIPPAGRWVFSPFFEKVERASPTWRSRPMLGAALAAAILLTVALGTLLYLSPAEPSYRTPVGGLASVPLPDGSKVTLNTDSEISVAVTEKERRVELTQGEAFFEVAKDPARPFIVRAGNKRVIAVGTKFSVRRDAQDVQVVVTEGKVRVETDGDSQPGSAEHLTAGSIAQASEAGVLVQTRQLAEVEESLSWRQGVLVFHQITLAEASAEFNRYNTRKIVIEDPGIASMQVAGSFRANNVEAFVRLLERGYPLRAEERGDQLVLTQKSKSE
jgi:transmembrane sensor